MTSRLALLTLAIATALGAAACRNAQAPADPAAEPASTTDAIATDPAAPPPMESTEAPATGATEVSGSQPMIPPADGAAADGTNAAASTSVAANDRNGDGGLSMDELPQGDGLRDQFGAADRDGNGMLSQAELDKHGGASTAQPAQ